MPEAASSWVHSIAGVVAGAVTTAVLHPLDLVKTRLQAHDGRTLTRAYRGTWHALRSIGGADGVKALYQGMTPNVVGSSVSWGLYLLVYSWLKQQLGEQGRQPLGSAGHLCAATGAGVVTALCTNPLWVLKTRMCLRTGPADAASAAALRPPEGYTSMLAAFRTILRTEGVVGLYAGLLPALLNVSHGAVQFVVYERLKLLLGRGSHDHSLAAGEALLVGGAAKVAASCSTYPLQVIKTRLQMQPELKAGRYRTLFDGIRQLLRYEGVSGFYKGLGANLIRVTPAAALTFAVYESVLRALR
eukprot:TRINITY_DN3219_c0_g1_i5.p1 TRINITY_DN3219_c0_g1~~TRINITY_DN3219_c0_g1_i5.p1  ORF type:complete len:301 (-),score=49.82 TRINITY_DN3219_c0_g1_i5:160-1062(-)